MTWARPATRGDDDGTYGREPWKSDRAFGGTVMVTGSQLWRLIPSP